MLTAHGKHTSWKSPSWPGLLSRAGDGNRTRVPSLGSSCSASELRPRAGVTLSSVGPSGLREDGVGPLELRVDGWRTVRRGERRSGPPPPPPDRWLRRRARWWVG